MRHQGGMDVMNKRPRKMSLPANRNEERELGYATGRRWRTRARTRVVAHPKQKGRVVYGEPVECGALRHAPVNELGVVFLFGMMAERLGFVVEAIRPTFPDCVGKRRVGPASPGYAGTNPKGIWASVRIEFEYESRNFRDHLHPAEGCDLIVCWEHNWLGCPLEVIALREEIGKLNRRDAEARRDFFKGSEGRGNGVALTSAFRNGVSERGNDGYGIAACAFRAKVCY